MTYKGPALPLFATLLLWMIFCVCACGLIYLGVPADQPDPRPIRTHAPLELEP